MNRKNMMLHQIRSSHHDRLRIVIASSEAVPWSKTGGLADVSSALPKSLSNLGHDVTLVVPYHRQTPYAQDNVGNIHNTGVKIEVPLANKHVQGQLYWTSLPGSEARVLLIDQPDYFDRSGLYQSDSGDYSDNCERFVFFSRAVLEATRSLVLRPHIIHANDWQTGLIPALLDIERRGTPGFENTRCVFTIHNLAFQGWFPSEVMPLTGLDWQYFNFRQMESHDHLNLLKTGVTFADQITTVSPTYMNEIQTPEFGNGLNETLSNRQDDLTGILNGIDADTWSPAADPRLVVNYDVDGYHDKKPICKDHLQQRLGLPHRREVPLFGMISRMTDQKGFDLITQVAKPILEQDVQIVFLGSGDERYEWMLKELAGKYPDKVSTTVGFDEQLAHEIEAGADFYLMPSRFEPCGLNQMYSLAYGTVPLVRAVGGLADSVKNVNPVSIQDGSATGIVFENYNSDSFFEAMMRCLALYRDAETHKKVIQNGMRRDSTWQRSAEEYLSVYRKALGSHHATTQQPSSQHVVT